MSEQTERMVQITLLDGHPVAVPASSVRTEHRAVLPDGRVVMPGALVSLFGAEDVDFFMGEVHKRCPEAPAESRIVVTLHADWTPA